MAGSANATYVARWFSGTGMNENNSALNFSVYPNPSNGNFTISSEEDINAIEIYNAIGEIISPLSLERGAAGEVIINLSEASKGIYFVWIIANDKTTTQRIVID